MSLHPSNPADSRLTVRRLLPGDAAVVETLAASLRRWFSPADLRQIATLLHDAPSGWVALDGAGSVVGFLLDAPVDEPGVREVAWMAVAEDWQRRGVGTSLLEAMIAAMPTAGVHTLEVSTVAASAGYAPYAATRAFYHRRGFVDTRIDPDYYWPGGDRLLLRKRIAPPEA